MTKRKALLQATHTCLQVVLGFSCGFRCRGHVGTHTCGNVLSASMTPSHEPAVGTDAFTQRTKEAKLKGGKLGRREEMEQSRGVAHLLEASMSLSLWI